MHTTIGGGYKVAERIESLERRNFNRLQLAQPVQCDLKGWEEQKGALSCDMSEGGMRLNIATFLPLHAEVMVKIQSNYGQVIECRAQVVWIQRIPFTERYQAGLEFIRDKDFIYTQKQIRKCIQAAPL